MGLGQRVVAQPSGPTRRPRLNHTGLMWLRGGRGRLLPGPWGSGGSLSLSGRLEGRLCFSCLINHSLPSSGTRSQTLGGIERWSLPPARDAECSRSGPRPARHAIHHARRSQQGVKRRRGDSCQRSDHFIRSGGRRSGVSGALPNSQSKPRRWPCPLPPGLVCLRKCSHH